MRKSSKKKYKKGKYKGESKSLSSHDEFDTFLSWLQEEIFLEIKEGYLLGISIEDIAKEWEITEEDVIRILKQEGIKIEES